MRLRQFLYIFLFCFLLVSCEDPAIDPGCHLDRLSGTWKTPDPVLPSDAAALVLTFDGDRLETSAGESFGVFFEGCFLHLLRDGETETNKIEVLEIGEKTLFLYNNGRSLLFYRLK